VPSGQWRGEYYGNRWLSGAPVLIRSDAGIDFDWGWGRPVRQVAADNFSIRWTRELVTAPGLYRFTTETDDGVRLYIDGRLVIDEWRAMSKTSFAYETYLSAGAHRIRMEYFEHGEVAFARLDWEGPLPVIARGNLVTHVPPFPSYSWIKVYRLTSENTWQDMNPTGWASISPGGELKIDGLPVDFTRYGDSGHPYKIEQWVNGRLVRRIGDVLRGQAAFRIRPDRDNHTSW
jgi:hypothetical protein